MSAASAILTVTLVVTPDDPTIACEVPDDVIAADLADVLREGGYDRALRGITVHRVVRLS